ncbi:MAG TPA: hypothetical protein VHP11_12295 [Tepidisphaeraceae bacterium]|nr:hypothetical protein [Tepidisphaeraceae bacterium]
MNRKSPTGTYQRPAPDAMDLLKRFPVEAMRQRSQWCGFQIVPQPGGKKPRKVPVVVPDACRKASNTDSSTWRGFDDAVRGLADGNYTAVGYALAGDVVGIDLDGERWVADDGKLSEEAQAIVKRCGSYAEWSISGRGIHVLMRGRLPAQGRRNDRAGVEIYDTKRFFIVTGRRLDGSPATITENQQAIDWLLSTYSDSQEPTEMTEKAEKAEIPEPTEKAETAEKAEQMASAISAVSAVSVDQIISQTLPVKQGQRNGCILRLARGLRFDAGLAIATYPQLKPVVRRWHAQAFAAIGTKNFDETWADFIRAWSVARVPLNFDAEGWALGKAKAEPPPPQADDYDTEAVRLLVGMCFHLASLHYARRFFLSSHRAGAALGVSHDKALRWLGMLCADSVLERVESGNERRATRYRWIGR